MASIASHAARLAAPFLAALWIAAPVSVEAQQTKILTADKHNEYGLVYTLPLTALEVEVTAVRTVRKAGPYYQYARKYIGTEKVVTEDSEQWTIEDVRVTPVGVPDPEARYLMQLKSGSPTYIGVAEDGMLLSVNARPLEQAQTSSELVQPEQEIFADKEYLQYVGGDFLASQSKAKQAQMLAESLMEIREAKVSLTRGTADQMPTDGRQLELMLNSLAHQEGALMAAFVGTVSSERVRRTFTFTPDEEGRSVLFRMSDFAGFVDADDYSGDPVYVDVKVTGQATMPVDSKGEEKKFPKDGVAYCIPGTARISLSLLGNPLWERELEIAQYGVVFGLDPRLFNDRKQPSYARFNAATGALEEFGQATDLNE